MIYVGARGAAAGRAAKCQGVKSGARENFFEVAIKYWGRWSDIWIRKLRFPILQGCILSKRIGEWDFDPVGVRRKEMKIGEVSSAMNSYQGQGSSVKAAPAQAVQKESAIVDFTAAPKDAKAAESENKNASVAPEGEGAEKNGGSQATSSLKEAVEKIKSANGNAEVVFGIHDGTNRVTIKMVDKQTKEVIKEFPADKTLDLIAKAMELAGIMVDEKR